MKAFLLLLSTGAMLLFSACSSVQTDVASAQRSSTYSSSATYSYATYPEYEPEPVDTVLHDPASLLGTPMITIDLSNQKALLYKGDTLVGVSRVSTGKSGFRTPTGSYRISQKNPNHRSNLYGDYVDSAGRVVKANVDIRKDSRPAGTHFRGAPMSYFMRFNGGIGMHAGYLPGYPASHGCVRMPRQMASLFYQNVGTGTRVKVTY
jgi:lipoprotein-anchoring transpeptidase ErfK/SrfK